MVQKVIERIWWVKKFWSEVLYCSNHYDVSVNKYGVKCGTSLRFWQNNGWINPIDPYGWFQWYFRYWLNRMSLDDERQISRWKGVVSRSKGKSRQWSIFLFI